MAGKPRWRWVLGASVVVGLAVVAAGCGKSNQQGTGALQTTAADTAPGQVVAERDCVADSSVVMVTLRKKGGDTTNVNTVGACGIIWADAHNAKVKIPTARRYEQGVAADTTQSFATDTSRVPVPVCRWMGTEWVCTPAKTETPYYKTKSGT